MHYAHTLSGVCMSHHPRTYVTDFTDKTNGSRLHDNIVRVYHVSNYSPNSMLAFASDIQEKKHTEASMIRAMDKELSPEIADTVRFTSTHSAVKCSVVFDSVAQATMALVDVISKGDMTFSIKNFRGGREYIDFGGAWVRIQFKQPSRNRAPKRLNETSHVSRTHKRVCV